MVQTKTRTADADQRVTLSDYITIIYRWRWTVLAVMIVVIAGAFVFSLVQETLYEAETKVLLPDPPEQIPTQIELAESPLVESRASEEMGLRGPDVPGSLDVTQVFDTQLLVFRYTASKAALATEAANAFSRSFIELRVERALRELADSRRFVQQRVEQAESALTRIARGLEAAKQQNQNARVTALQSRRAALLKRLKLLQRRVIDLATKKSVRRRGVEIVQRAALPPSPISPKPARNIILGALSGLVLGIMAAFVAESTRTSHGRRTG